MIRDQSPAPLWHVAALWLLASAALTARLVLSDDPFDADSLMRLQQVRDWLAGQSWWDVTQYRMNPPEGTPMHWSRLVDLPVAALIMLLGLALPQAAAQYTASAIVPLVYLGIAMLLLRAITLRLGVPGRLVPVGLALAALFPLLPIAFAPMTIDHHGPQALAALGCVLMFLKAPSPRAALAGGALLALWCAISLEGLPVLGVLAGGYGLRYVFVKDRSLAYFLSALALASPLLSYATRPSSEYALWCDILLPAHFITFATGAALAWLVTFAPRQQTAPVRFGSLAVIPLVCAPLAFTLLGRCAVDPFGAMDPLVDHFFHGYVQEGLPFWSQDYDMMAMMLYLPIVLAAGWWSVGRLGWSEGPNRAHWLGYLLLAFGMTLYGLALMREMVIAQMLALPFALGLLAYWMPKARALTATLPRVLATVLVLLAVGPLGITLAGKMIAAQAAPSSEQAVTIVVSAQAVAACDFADLRSLPQGHVFTTVNSAPDVIGYTDHTAEVGVYHRAQVAMRRSILAFRSDADAARTIIEAQGTDYLAVCLLDDSLQLFAQDRPESLAYRLLRNDPPEWLERHPDFANAMLRVYTLR